MTGFARAEGSDGTLAWIWEARSVNGKGLDIRCRLPAGYDELDAAAREAAGSRFRRGNVSLALSLDKTQVASPLKVNRAALEAVLSVARELSASESLEPPSVDGLLRLPVGNPVLSSIEDPVLKMCYLVLLIVFLIGITLQLRWIRRH